MQVVEWVISVLKITPARWQSLAGALSAELVQSAPLPGEWSALECLLHLVDAERSVFPVRVDAFLAGRDFPAFHPDEQGTKPAGQSLAGLADEFAGLRQASLDRLARLGATDLERKARHQELGIVSLNELLHEWAAHDLMHTVQAERALMQPFIRSCGPWQVYFTDHVARPRP
jgi:hypothetical protein